MSDKKCTLCDAVRMFKDKGLSQEDSLAKAVKWFYDDSCVSRKVKIFHDEHPDWDDKHCVAAAIGYCEGHKE